MTQLLEVSIVIRTMIREIERLHEDNLQLRAAVHMYREVLRHSGPAVLAERRTQESARGH